MVSKAFHYCLMWLEPGGPQKASATMFLYRAHWLGIVTCTYNPGTWEIEARGLPCISAQFELLCETVSSPSQFYQKSNGQIKNPGHRLLLQHWHEELPR